MYKFDKAREARPLSFEDSGECSDFFLFSREKKLPAGG